MEVENKKKEKVENSEKSEKSEKPQKPEKKENVEVNLGFNKAPVANVTSESQNEKINKKNKGSKRSRPDEKEEIKLTTDGTSSKTKHQRLETHDIHAPKSNALQIDENPLKQDRSVPVDWIRLGCNLKIRFPKISLKYP